MFYFMVSTILCRIFMYNQQYFLYFHLPPALYSSYSYILYWASYDSYSITTINLPNPQWQTITQSWNLRIRLCFMHMNIKQNSSVHISQKSDILLTRCSWYGYKSFSTSHSIFCNSNMFYLPYSYTLICFSLVAM